MCIVSTVSSVRAVGNVIVRGVNKVKLRKKNYDKTRFPQTQGTTTREASEK